MQWHDSAPSSPSPPSSLFDAPYAASRTAPPIPGLFFDPALLLPHALAASLLHHCTSTYFAGPANQVMLFSRAPSPSSSSSGLPPFLHALLPVLAALLPPHTHALLFPDPQTMARQAILNRYAPGEGIRAHVDLVRRFADGIVGVSLGSGCVMRFERVGGQDAHELYLPPRSVLVLSGEARYGWTHAIEDREGDWVLRDGGDHFDGETGDGGGGQGGDADPDVEWLPRTMRVSITLRWLLPGADVVGDPEPREGEREKSLVDGG